MKHSDSHRDHFFGPVGSASILERGLTQPPSQHVWLESLTETTTQWRNQKKLLVRDLKRILVVRLDDVGDLILLGPSLRTLREALPEAEITLLTSPAGNHVAPLLPWVDKSIVCDALWQDISGKIPFDPSRELTLIEQLRQEEFQLAIIFTSLAQSPFPAAYACYLAGIPNRLGFSSEFGGNVLSLSPIPPSEDIHQVDRNLTLLQQMVIPLRYNNRLELHVPLDVQQKADQLLASVGIKPHMPFIAVAPGASCETRRYNPDRFASAVRMLSMETTLPIVILGNAREAEEIQPVIDVANESSSLSIHSLVGQTTVPEFAAIIQRASLTIGNNSAVMHMADAFQCPMVILYSGANLINQWQPRNAPARLLCRPVFCAPCYNFDCPYGLECLDIRPQEVVAAALELLAGKFYSRIPMTKLEEVNY
jgi:ADP-heptose:LPS heptosyltransferase